MANLLQIAKNVNQTGIYSTITAYHLALRLKATTIYLRTIHVEIAHNLAKPALIQQRIVKVVFQDSFLVIINA